MNSYQYHLVKVSEIKAKQTRFDKKGFVLCSVKRCKNYPSWWVCKCGGSTCKNHQHFAGQIVSYCIICRPDKFKKTNYSGESTMRTKLKRIETNPLLDDLLARGRLVTEKYVKRFGEWTIIDQINHIKSEVREFEAEAILRNNKYNQLEEGSDIIYTVITMFHLLGITDKEIIHGLQHDLRKVEMRCEKRCEWGDKSK